jgi:serine/threonine protein kinase
MLAAVEACEARGNAALWIVSEYVPGPTLEAWASGGRVLPVAAAIDFMRRLSLGVQAALAQGVSPHAINPRNVVIWRQDPRSGLQLDGKLLDLGLAAWMCPDLPQLECAHFMAPETLSAVFGDQNLSEPAGSRANVYSCGALLYYLTTGELPFRSESVEQLMAAQADGQLVRPSFYNEHVSTALECVIMGALAVRACERYASPGEFASVLDAVEERHRRATLPPALASEQHEPQAAWAAPQFAAAESSVQPSAAVSFAAKVPPPAPTAPPSAAADSSAPPQHASAAPARSPLFVAASASFSAAADSNEPQLPTLADPVGTAAVAPPSAATKLGVQSPTAPRCLVTPPPRAEFPAFEPQQASGDLTPVRQPAGVFASAQPSSADFTPATQPSGLFGQAERSSADFTPATQPSGVFGYATQPSIAREPPPLPAVFTTTLRSATASEVPAQAAAFAFTSRLSTAIERSALAVDPATASAAQPLNASDFSVQPTAASDPSVDGSAPLAPPSEAPAVHFHGLELPAPPFAALELSAQLAAGLDLSGARDPFKQLSAVEAGTQAELETPGLAWGAATEERLSAPPPEPIAARTRGVARPLFGGLRGSTLRAAAMRFFAVSIGVCTYFCLPSVTRAPSGSAARATDFVPAAQPAPAPIPPVTPATHARPLTARPGAQLAPRETHTPSKPSANTAQHRIDEAATERAVPAQQVRDTANDPSARPEASFSAAAAIAASGMAGVDALEWAEQHAPAAVSGSAPKQHSSTASQPVPAAVTGEARVKALEVRGSLTSSAVRRAMERVRPHWTECYVHVASVTGQLQFAPVHVALVIDEAGRARDSHITTSGPAAFTECLSHAMSKLTAEVPDTGTVAVLFDLHFEHLN